MKPQIIDRYVYVKGVKISEATSKSNLDGNETLPLAYNDVNYNTTVDQISEYVDKVHDYLTTENYNDLKGQIDSERTNRQEADTELNKSIQDTKSELHSTISGVESELLNKIDDVQEQVDNINDTGAANGVTLDTAQTITGQKTFATVPKSTANATEDTDLVNKKYVDDAVQNADVDLDGYATEAWVNEQGFARTSDIPEGLELGETTGTAFPGDRGKAVEDKVSGLTGYYVGRKNSDMLMYETTTEDSVSLNYYKFDFNNPDAPLSNQRVTFDAATTSAAGIMSAADKQKLDSLSDSSNVYVIDYLTENSGIITQEQYNEIRSAIEENKVIILMVDTLQYFVTSSFLKNSSLKLYFSLNDITQVSDALQVNALICHINHNGEYYTENPHINLYSNGDGTRFLSDNGTYETITQPDLSNYVDQDTFNESITQLGSTITNEVTELEKTDANLSTQISTINESISGLDNKYLPLSGGALTGNLTLPSNGTLTVGNGTMPASVVINSQGSISTGARTTINHNGIIIEKSSGSTPYIKVGNNLAVTTSNSGGLLIESITQSEYDGLDSKGANTLYIITE